MILDKYSSIDEYINKNEPVLLSVVDLCDRLCGSDVHLRNLAA